MSTSKAAQVLGALAAVGLACGTMMIADGPGVRPRLNATAYPASGAVDKGSVAAAALARSEVRGNFSADLNKGYLVFEVSFYPAAGSPMRISPTGFTLKAAQKGDAITPSEPGVVARSVGDKSAPKQATGGGITVVPVATVGYETGTYNNGNGPAGNNGNNGQRRSGVYSSVGVAVAGGVGSGGAAYPPDRYSIEAELFDKSLPEGPITNPTAGYLYFPAPKTKLKAGAVYELEYAGEAGKITLSVPVPNEK